MTSLFSRPLRTFVCSAPSAEARGYCRRLVLAKPSRGVTSPTITALKRGVNESRLSERDSFGVTQNRQALCAATTRLEYLAARDQAAAVIAFASAGSVSVVVVFFSPKTKA